ncbi:hypothetical protein THAOC_19653 [Thalassiosira oceanica]|uniref:Uncharacterized protein n=1 Tax=Thalassiosira oceanica TaxID=159749 RepID=K0S1V7_THAOC|nr:hypothetical protein THAOC_19653 [Thalassiosira oceanica]|eukprot:EJK60063.1 hypothetical protein THAOC_19653 [Thalassiosira oceanica]
MRSGATSPVTTGPVEYEEVSRTGSVREVLLRIGITNRFDIAGREIPAPTATPNPTLLAPFRIVYRPPAAHTPPPSPGQGRGPPVRCRRAPYYRIEPQIQICDDSPPSSHRSRPNEAVSANIFRDEHYQLDVHT